VSYELEFCTPENASVLIGRILSDHTSRHFDHYVFDDVAADETCPAGLLNGVTPLAPTTGGGFAAMAKDVANIVAAVAAAGGNADGVVFIASAAQATTLRLLSGPNFTNPVLGTRGLAGGTIVGVDLGATDLDRPDPGLDCAVRPMAMTHDAVAAILI
jgi:hypothetical protein